MASLSLKGQADINETASLLKSGILSSGITCELMGEAQRQTGGGKAIMMVFEKYYMRASNRASLSVMLTQDADMVYVDAVGSGGGQGPIFRFSWGTEESFVNVVQRILSPKGFS